MSTRTSIAYNYVNNAEEHPSIHVYREGQDGFYHLEITGERANSSVNVIITEVMALFLRDILPTEELVTCSTRTKIPSGSVTYTAKP